jgi:hypothetical protein
LSGNEVHPARPLLIDVERMALASGD